MRRPGRARRGVRLIATGRTRGKKRDNPEQRLAMTVAEFLDAALPRDAVWWHTPNSIWTTIKQAGVHKAMGVKSGVADCIIVWSGGAYAIELKVGRGTLSAAQEVWRDAFRVAGGKWAIAWSADDVEAFLRGWRIPLRATLQPGGGWRAAA